MLRRTLAAAAVVAGLALGVASTASAGDVDSPWYSTVVGAPTSGTWDRTHTYAVNGKARTCTLTRGAKCVGAKLRGRVKHHGDLRGANLRRADLRFADLRGANLQGADLRSANLKHADLRGANLKGAKFQYARPVHGKQAKRGNQTPSCLPNCVGADLDGANLVGANLSGANLSYANLYYANLSHAILVRTKLSYADAYHANLTGANLTDANLTGVTWYHTVCPDGTVTYTGCPT